jgi:hypothetical protein
MLKFIRKYQLIILVIGGSLLMVVFLLEPVLTRLSPDPGKATAATLSDGSRFSRNDMSRASFDINVFKRVYPRLLMPVDQGGLGLDISDESNTELHWLLLTKQAQDAGLVGDDAEGRTWVQVLAEIEASAQFRAEDQQGLITSEQQANERFLELTQQIEQILVRNINVSLGMMRGLTEDDIYRTLAKARAVQRMYQLYQSTPSFSDMGAIQAAKNLGDAIAVDAAVVTGSMIAPAIPDPSEEELQAFFDEHKDDNPQTSDLGIGYVQPSRVKIGWLTLDKNAIMNAIELDRVELRKIWRRDRELPENQRQYPGDFAAERAEIEAAQRDKLATDLMIEADRIIRAQILQTTRSLSKQGDRFILPDDWEQKRPDLEAIAQAVVSGVKEQFNVDIPLPSVEIRTDRWLGAMEIAQSGQFGMSAYRVGSRSLNAFQIPLILDDPETAALIKAQVGIPLADPAATDSMGNRYYALVYDRRPAGAAESIDDAGRDKVLADYKAVKGYQLLADNIGLFNQAIAGSGDLAPAIDAALALAPGADIERPGVARNILVRAESVSRGNLATRVEPALNTETFRSAVMSATENLDPLTTPEQVAQDPIAVTVAIPKQRAVALSSVVAPRPLTAEQYNSQINQLVLLEGARELRAAVEESGRTPFELETLKSRFGVEVVSRRDDDSDQG